MSEGRPKSKDKRREERQAVKLPALLSTAAGEVTCEVLNISPGGAKVEAQGEFDKHAEVTLSFDDYGRFDGRVVWRQAKFHGLQFKGDHDKIAEILLAVALYRST